MRVGLRPSSGLLGLSGQGQAQERVSREAVGWLCRTGKPRRECTGSSVPIGRVTEGPAPGAGMRTSVAFGSGGDCLEKGVQENWVEASLEMPGVCFNSPSYNLRYMHFTLCKNSLN